MILGMLDQREIWGSSRLDKDENVVEGETLESASSGELAGYIHRAFVPSQSLRLGIRLNSRTQKSAAWLDSQEFTAAFTSSLSLKRFPPRLYRKRRKLLGARLGLHGPKPPSQKIRLTPETFEKCEALRYSGGVKHLLTACRPVCFAMLFGASVELRSRHLS
ncbi:hypothetical protein TNCV_5104621 [Trichonephila clavipes]|nr:hypothetical protein TNCV_5104621 [Trichonephila clavipes]